MTTKIFVIAWRGGGYSRRSDGYVYGYETSKDAVRIVNICYGISIFKTGIFKIKRIPIEDFNKINENIER